MHGWDPRILPPPDPQARLPPPRRFPMLLAGSPLPKKQREKKKSEIPAELLRERCYARGDAGTRNWRGDAKLGGGSPSVGGEKGAVR